jgi:sulfoxide reductase heme-binding subunit YedZ
MSATGPSSVVTRYWRRRLTRHALLALASLAVTAVAGMLPADGILVFRLSMGTAYAGLALIAASLLVGPWNVLKRNPNPVSSDVRRDIGIWAAILSLAHVTFGLQVHLPGRMLQYFLWAPQDNRPIPARYDAWGATNWAGIAAMLVLLVLFAISNDAALRRLGTARWKWLQRWNYVAFGLIAVHGAIYQLLERRTVPWIVVYGAMIVTVAAAQLIGWRRYRAGRRATSGLPAAPSVDRSPPQRPSSLRM